MFTTFNKRFIFNTKEEAIDAANQAAARQLQQTLSDNAEMNEGKANPKQIDDIINAYKCMRERIYEVYLKDVKEQSEDTDEACPSCKENNAPQHGQTSAECTARSIANSFVQEQRKVNERRQMHKDTDNDIDPCIDRELKQSHKDAILRKIAEKEKQDAVKCEVAIVGKINLDKIKENLPESMKVIPSCKEIEIQCDAEEYITRNKTLYRYNMDSVRAIPVNKVIELMKEAYIAGRMDQ